MIKLKSILAEIGNSVYKVNYSASGGLNTMEYIFSIDDNQYIAEFNLNFRDRIDNFEYAYLRIDFAVRDKTANTWSNIMTNANQQYKVIGAIAFLFGEFFNDLLEDIKTIKSTYDLFKDVILDYIIISGKSEKENDSRRANLYDAYIKNQAKKYGIHIINTTKKNIYNADDALIELEYKLTPFSFVKPDNKFIKKEK